MSTPRLLELAKDGHPAAISKLINQQLQDRGVTAIASRDGSCLRLLLEAHRSPQAPAVMPYLTQALTRLASPAFDEVAVYGRRQGSRRNWYRHLVLEQGVFVQRPEDLDESARSESLRNESLRNESLRNEGVVGQQPSKAWSGSGAAQRARQRHYRDTAAAELNAQLLAPVVPGATLTRVRPSAKIRPGSKVRPGTDRAPLLLPDSPRSRSKQRGFQRAWQRSAQLKRLRAQRRQRQISQVSPSVGSTTHPLGRFFSLWLQWQGAAWMATFVTSLIAVLLLGIVAFAIFSLANRITGTATLLLTLIPLGIIILTMGLLLGDAQARILQRWLNGTNGWRWLTVLGFSGGGLIAWQAYLFLNNSLSPLISSPSQGFAMGQGVSFASTTVGIIFGLLCLSALQWSVIRAQIPRAYEWVLINVFGGLFSWWAGMAASTRWILPLMEDNASYDFWISTLSISVGGFFAWLIFHAIGGLSVARLLQNLPTRD